MRLDQLFYVRQAHYRTQYPCQEILDQLLICLSHGHVVGIRCINLKCI